jgi:hypothetical protein
LTSCGSEGSLTIDKNCTDYLGKEHILPQVQRTDAASFHEHLQESTSGQAYFIHIQGSNVLDSTVHPQASPRSHIIATKEQRRILKQVLSFVSLALAFLLLEILRLGHHSCRPCSTFRTLNLLFPRCVLENEDIGIYSILDYLEDTELCCISIQQFWHLCFMKRLVEKQLNR